MNRTSSGDLQFVGDGTFEPGTNITLTVTPSASGSRAQCIFDGYVLSWRLHLDRASTSSTIEVWAQDASWLMNIDDQVAEWSGQTDGEVANMIFGNYGFTTADGNTLNDSPRHTAGRPHAVPARDGPAVPARPGPARREAVPGRLHRHPGGPDRVFRDSCGRRPARDHDFSHRPHQLDGRHPRLRLGCHAPHGSGLGPGRPHPVRRLRHRGDHRLQRPEGARRLATSPPISGSPRPCC